jgi:hypothetical protein
MCLMHSLSCECVCERESLLIFLRKRAFLKGVAVSSSESAVRLPKIVLLKQKLDDFDKKS